MNQSEKALAACREYDRLMTSIAKAKRDIGDGLDRCDRRFTGPSGDNYIPDGKQTHLADAFDFCFDEDAYGEVRMYHSELEQIEIIGDCEGCMKAWKAVRERKEDRKKLGIVKRSIRAIARAKGGAA